jgi:hypothetical protein
MKYNNTTLLTFSVFAFMIFFSGIRRHDVEEKKYLELGRQKQFDCVGQVFLDSSFTGYDGSCVLISDRFALSAAHVFMISDKRQDTVNYYGKIMVINSNTNPRVKDIAKILIRINGKMVKVKKITIHPNYLDSSTKGSCDLALIQLEQPQTAITPAKLNTNFDELNSNVVGVGYGASGPADQPDVVKVNNKKIAGENVIDSLTGSTYSGYKTVMMCDFDHPTIRDCNKMGSPKPRPLEYISTGGDSGCGLFRQVGEEWKLVGILHGGGVNIDQLMKTGYYGQVMEWTRVSVFANWLSEQTK